MVSFSALALLAGTATAIIAGPDAPLGSIPECWDWDVENWTAGCGRHGCYYNFNVTVPNPQNPDAGVTAYCRGSEQGYDNSFTVPSNFVLCRILYGSNNAVAARFSLREQNDTSFGPKNIEVSYLYPPFNGRIGYNYTAIHEAKYNQFTSNGLNFTMTPTEVFSTNDTSLSSRQGPII